MDPDNILKLGKPDVETIYKMVYNCDDYDSKEISILPFDKHEILHKKEFMDHIRRKAHFVQPGKV